MSLSACTHPGNFLVNGVELIFTVDSTQAKTLKSFRCRQKVAEQGLWEKKGAKSATWEKTMSSGGESDDPDEGLQKFALPIIAFHDAPGFMAVASSHVFSGPAYKNTNEHALAVFMRQNFIAWIDGQGSSSSGWTRVSEEVKWHSNQSLIRSSPSAKWIAAPGNKIALGHTFGTPS